MILIFLFICILTLFVAFWVALKDVESDIDEWKVRNDMTDIELVIKIPEENYERIKFMEEIGALNNPYLEAIANGTPIPDNATNGDVMTIIFPKIGVYDEWYEEPYQKGGTNRKNCEYRHENGNCLKVGGFCMSVDDEHCVKGGKE